MVVSGEHVDKKGTEKMNFASFVIYFQATLRDEALFPLRCCGQPILDEEDSFLLPSPPLMARIKEKEEERQTVEKTYCSNPRCSAFLPALKPRRRHAGKSLK
jgi:hypothetical protein